MSGELFYSYDVDLSNKKRFMPICNNTSAHKKPYKKHFTLFSAKAISIMGQGTDFFVYLL